MNLRSERFYKVDAGGGAEGQSQGQRRFTLVELILVLTLLMALASIILPVIYRMSLVGKSTQCSANLAQVGQWLTAYTSSNDGVMIPYTMGWVQKVSEQGRVRVEQGSLPANEFMCPSQGPESIRGQDPVNMWRGSHYGINEHISSDQRNQQGELTAYFALMRVPAIVDPGGKVVMGDASGSNYLGIPGRDPVITGLSRHGYTHADALPPDPAQPLPYHRHIDGTTNLFFLDNHVENVAEWPRFMTGPGTYGYQMWHPQHTYPGSGFESSQP